MVLVSVELRTPVDEYLARQRDMSAVERFADHHDRATGPLHERWYRDLMPASPPGPGQQYRFEVDMDACTSCKSCVSACHSLNGLDEGEMWRSVGVVIGTGPSGPTQQTVTTACHHCVDPACLSGCPVDAYDKDPITGIVSHLDDQCIGCTYCTWTCPYEVPRFNERLGIVRKCDMCTDRLSVGEAPACVQACPTGAISIGIVDVEELRLATAVDDAIVPGAPRSSLTIPTTLYRRTEPLPVAAVATDAWSERPQHPHTPLVVMLVLTQFAVGTFAMVGALTAGRADLDDRTRQWCITVALLTGLVALGASVGHLGRPLQAWRAVIGIGHSWLSREIVAFGAFAALATLAAGLAWVDAPGGVVEPGAAVAGALATAVGLAAVWCSVMVYAVTGRRWWRLDRTARAFGVTTLVGGASVAAFVVAVASTSGAATVAGSIRPVMVLTVLVAAPALVADAWVMRPGGSRDPRLARSGWLLREALARTSVVRFACTAVGGVLLPLLVLSIASAPAPDLGVIRVLTGTAVISVVVGELAGRQLFFRAMVAPRMPGIPR